MADTKQQHIKLYNTKTRSLELFTPIKEGEVSIYSCGPTVYHYAHIGNLRAYVFADVLRRMFVSNEYTVKHIINITDVGHLVGDGNDGQDKLEKGAAREGKTVKEIAEFYTRAFMKDLESLNIPTKEYQFPRAADIENIVAQISLIEILESKGYAYKISDGIYFDTSKFKAYGDFAHLDIEGLRSGARVEENSEKKNITDFALWKFSPKHEQRQMEWDSKWGKGFPGWHIECSAMSMKYLGKHFDIHTGGVDHIPVHHTNEIAQSECANDDGKSCVNCWMHVNFLNDTTGKMAKSNDDFLTLETLINKETKEKYNPMVYRYFLLMTHYRKEINFSYIALDAAAVAYERLSAFIFHRRNHQGNISTPYMNLFKQNLANDLNTAEAVATMWGMLRDDTLSEGDKYTTLIEMNNLLGLGLEHAQEKIIVIPEEVQRLLDLRKVARDTKNFTESDRLRDEIATHGFAVQDGAEGQTVVPR